MRHHALDGHMVHLRQRATQHRRNEKERGYLLGVQEIRNESATSRSWHSQLLQKVYEAFARKALGRKESNIVDER
jgi:hypothetical protein